MRHLVSLGAAAANDAPPPDAPPPGARPPDAGPPDAGPPGAGPLAHLAPPSGADCASGPTTGAEADPAFLGAKAERLWRALEAGLPVLPGWVVPARCARPALRAGAAAIRARGIAAGRRAVLGTELDGDLAAELAEAARLLGGRVIVRSSSPLEAESCWAGAFASVAEAGPDDIVTAVRSVWASAFAPDPLGRLAACGLTPEQVEMAVLVQSEIRPDAGGTARTDGGTARTDGAGRGEAVIVHGVRGHPGPMLAGWADGASAAARGDRCTGDLAALIGRDTVLATARLARAALLATGADGIEWALADGDVWLLQAVGRDDSRDDSRAPGTSGIAGATGMAGAADADARRVPGNAAVEGIGTGRLLFRRPHDALPPDAGDVVLLVDRPVPALAPLLFTSRTRAGAGVGAAVRGVISRGGPAGSHLAQVARSCGIPMVVGCPVAEPSGDGQLATVNGFAGEVTLRPARRSEARR
ncbi:MAG: hypothetical protein JOY82_19430 [Streptosporangiaceae bacterium]|nr:hypothetical protein [Streptosporangiaceae bacterium]MBV9856658.1 hypothetical protein [Streptosporangiaceae bacterium]